LAPTGGVPDITHGRHPNPPLRHDPIAVRKAPKIDSSAHVGCSQIGIEIPVSVLQISEFVRVEIDPNGARDIGHTIPITHGFELKANEPIVRFAATRKPQTVRVKECVAEEHVGVWGKIKIAIVIGLNEAVLQKVLCRSALEGGPEIPRGTPPLLLPSDLRVRIHVPRITHRLVSIHLLAVRKRRR
jgi:hypothetical protein